MGNSPAARRVKAAYLELLEENPSGRITVTEVARRAHINRITFYRLYETLDDVLIDALDEFDETVVELMGQMDYEAPDRGGSLHPLLEHHRRNMPMLRAILESDKAPVLERRIEDGVRRPVTEQLYAGPHAAGEDVPVVLLRRHRARHRRLDSWWLPGRHG